MAHASPIIACRHLEISGTVQGVGFRPFVHRLAIRHGLGGWVRNRSGDVEIEVEGPAAALDAFVRAMRTAPPPLAHVERVTVWNVELAGWQDFEIRASQVARGASQPVPPDTAPCEACVRELFDPCDRRYRYPFINCTDCGPRFTIINALPYDRPQTTMRAFPLCTACAIEYADPSSRRFHAEPIACPTCGPRLALEPDEDSGSGDPLAAAVLQLRQGQIVGIKGLGGFHLACDARNADAVARLRHRKHRGAKPLAVMFPDLPSIRALCRVSEPEAALLASPRRPIVLLSTLARTDATGLASAIAPGLAELGAMLPSTPLHYLLLHDFGGPLVMTSGNLSEEPIAADNDEARRRLGHIADSFLLHDRAIASRYDDSVVRVWENDAVLIRRARSYAPTPLELPFVAQRPVLAYGAHLKNTFCLLRESRAYLSPHIGDLENLETIESLQATLDLFTRLFAVQPEIVAHDLHPEYLSTKLALGMADVTHVGVQHHHAHVVSCLVEHGQRGPALGVAFDGLGYGTDGHLWGGEVLVADWGGFQRRAHLREAPLPGGIAAIRKPYRMALAYIFEWFPSDLGAFAPFLDGMDEHEMAIIRQQIVRGVQAAPTSSCGRLFDAVAALLGIRTDAQYEGQAAAELQARADPAVRGSYPYELRLEDGVWIADPAPLLWALYADYRAGTPVAAVAMRFHNAVADLTADLCRRLAAETGLRQVALGGGVFQNTLLLGEVVRRLRRAELEVYVPRRVPTNDGGLSFGQAVIAHAVCKAGTDG